MSTVGETFKTGNATVATLPVGTVLQVVGPGKLQIGTVAVAGASKPFAPEPGDDIYIPAKDRTGVMVRAGVTVKGFLKDGEIFYVDDEPCVRIVNIKDAQPA